MIELFLNSLSIGHSLYSLGAGLGLTAFCLTDMLYLRTIIILSYILKFTAGFLFPNTAIIVWSILYIVINFLMILFLLLERFPLNVPEDIMPLCSLFKYSMSPRDFLRIINLSSLMQLKQGGYFV